MTQPSPLNVVHIASGDSWAGAEVQLYTLAKTLHCLDDVLIKIILLNYGELERRLRTLGIPLEVLDETQLSTLQIFNHIRALLKKWQPDIVHSHRLKENILAGLASKFAGNIPSLRTVHGAPEHKPGWRDPHKQILYFLDWLIGRFIQKRIISVSFQLSNMLKKKFPSWKVIVIENGVDIEALAPYAKHQKTGYDQSTPLKIGIAGRLVPVKRVDLFIDIAKYFHTHHPDINVHFHIIGDGPLRKTLENYCNSLNIQSIVHFEGHCDDIIQQLLDIDLLLMTSDHEGLPMILLEAMSIGTPVISHAVGGIPNLLCYGSCGILVSEQSASAFSEAIIDAMSHLDKLTRIKKKALLQINNHYTAKINAEKYISIYYEIR